MAAPARRAAVLAREDLHGSLRDPLLDSMNFLNEVTQRFPGAISFAPGRPRAGMAGAEDTLDADRVAAYLRTYTAYLERELGLSPAGASAALFQYGRTKGLIHQLVATTLANDEGIHVSPEAIVLTVGAQEGMLLVLRVLSAGPADVLLASSPCYVGITGAARLLDTEVVPVAEGPGGPDPEAVADAARRARAAGKRPRAFYVVPDFANPSGASMTVAARERLLEVAREEDLLVLEDNPYGFFTCGSAPRPTLKSLDRDGRVVYLGSFAKTCFPGARLGYVVAEAAVAAPDGSRGLLADEVAKVKSMVSVNTASLSQAVVGGMLLESGCRLREATAGAARAYQDSMRALLSGLERHFPAEDRQSHGVTWHTPDGGWFVVVTVPFAADEAALEVSGRRYGVLWTPMRPFYPDGGGDRELRLSCSYVTPDQVDVGVRRLKSFITSVRGR